MGQLRDGSEDPWRRGPWGSESALLGPSSLLMPAASVEFTLRVSGLGFNRGFPSLSRLPVPQEHDPGLRVRSPLTSVGCILCFRYVQYVTKSSRKPAEVSSERSRSLLTSFMSGGNIAPSTLPCALPGCRLRSVVSASVHWMVDDDDDRRRERVGFYELTDK